MTSYLLTYIQKEPGSTPKKRRRRTCCSPTRTNRKTELKITTSDLTRFLGGGELVRLPVIIAQQSVPGKTSYIHPSTAAAVRISYYYCCCYDYDSCKQCVETYLAQKTFPLSLAIPGLLAVDAVCLASTLKFVSAVNARDFPFAVLRGPAAGGEAAHDLWRLSLRRVGAIEIAVCRTSREAACFQNEAAHGERWLAIADYWPSLCK